MEGLTRTHLEANQPCSDRYPVRLARKDIRGSVQRSSSAPPSFFRSSFCRHHQRRCRLRERPWRVRRWRVRRRDPAREWLHIIIIDQSGAARTRVTRSGCSSREPTPYRKLTDRWSAAYQPSIACQYTN